MPLPQEELELVKELLGRFCQARSGSSVRVEFTIKGNRVTLIETRPLFIDPAIMNSVYVAQFEFSPKLHNWTLHWYDRKNKRQPYPTGRNRDDFEKLIAEVNADPTGVFWD